MQAVAGPKGHNAAKPPAKPCPDTPPPQPPVQNAHLAEQLGAPHPAEQAAPGVAGKVQGLLEAQQRVGAGGAAQRRDHGLGGGGEAQGGGGRAEGGKESWCVRCRAGTL